MCLLCAGCDVCMNKHVMYTYIYLYDVCIVIARGDFALVVQEARQDAHAFVHIYRQLNDPSRPTPATPVGKEQLSLAIDRNTLTTEVVARGSVDPSFALDAKNPMATRVREVKRPLSSVSGSTERIHTDEHIYDTKKTKPSSSGHVKTCAFCENVEGSTVSTKAAEQGQFVKYLRCGGCGVAGNVYYCSRKHQVEDWKKGHKRTCLRLNKKKISS